MDNERELSMMTPSTTSMTSTKNINSILTTNDNYYVNKNEEDIEYQNEIKDEMIKSDVDVDVDENNKDDDMFDKSDNKLFPKYNMKSIVINKYNSNNLKITN